ALSGAPVVDPSSSGWTFARVHGPRASGTGPLLSVAHHLHRAGEPVGETLRRVVQRQARDELLDCEIFESLLEAQVLAEDFRIDHSTCRPHSSLGYSALVKFR